MVSVSYKLMTFPSAYFVIGQTAWYPTACNAAYKTKKQEVDSHFSFCFSLIKLHTIEFKLWTLWCIVK